MSSTKITPSDDGVLDAIVIGAGFSGMYQLYKLRNEGFHVKVLEAGSDLGGVWHWNCYPGARVDCHVPNYEFSIESVWRNWYWKERYPSWEEIQNYYKHIDNTLELSKDINLDSRVISAQFNNDNNTWVVRCSNGEEYTTKFLLPCTGYASKPYLPKIEGSEQFLGLSFHSSRWPEQGITLENKKVAIIGTGASGVQITQEAAKVASHVTVFQRTPNIAFPMRQKDLTRTEQDETKHKYPEYFKLRDTSVAGLHDVAPDPRSALEVSEAERTVVFESAWEKGGLHLLSPFSDTLVNVNANKLSYDFWRSKTIRRINDPKLANKLAPETPPHPYGVKRPSLEQGFFETFNQDNVDLVDLKEQPIIAITPNGIKLESSEHEFDIIIYATGFDSNTGGLTQIDFRGTTTHSLADIWADGVNTLLGIGIPEFPNLLMLYGPQSPAAFWNGPASAEVQGTWVVNLLKFIRTNHYSRIETNRDAAYAWSDRMNKIADFTLLSKTNSWYMGGNIPGKRKQLLNHFGVKSYLDACHDSEQNGYSGFEFS